MIIRLSTPPVKDKPRRSVPRKYRGRIFFQVSFILSKYSCSCKGGCFSQSALLKYVSFFTRWPGKNVQDEAPGTRETPEKRVRFCRILPQEKNSPRLVRSRVRR